MSVQKIVGLLAILLAVVGAFATIPYLPAILVIAGLFLGLSVEAENHVRVLVSALVLASLSGSLNAIPTVGSYLASFFGNFGFAVAGAALMIVACNTWKRFKP
jgi:hypothetical protein